MTLGQVRNALLGLVLLTAGSEAHAETRRLAVVIGNNAGSGELPPLRYAENDAGKLARVLVELGDVGAEDLYLLQGRPVSEVERALTLVRDRIQELKRQPDLRSVLLFYFSGHSDGEAMELGREKLSFARLKALLAGTGAELRVAIIDACKSGAALREKGGRPAEPFVIKLTDALTATGEAFITSSAANEAALESSEVMGSFFTHNLVSGLRGAADVSGDQLVTLSEAYRYAYERTVAATAMLPVGAQHPSYDYRLSGQGELVLASLAQTPARLVLPAGAERVLVSDLGRDQVIVEVPSGGGREIGLPPGKYGVRLMRGGQSFGGRIHLPPQARLELRWEALAPLGPAPAVAAKGGPAVRAELASPNRAFWSLTAGASGAVAREVGAHGVARLGFEPSEGSGLSFGALGSHGERSGFIERSAQLRLGYRWALERGPFWFSLGLEAGASYWWQLETSRTASSLSVLAAPRAVARLRLHPHWWLSLEAEAPVHTLRVDDQLQAVWVPAASLGLSLAL